MNLKEAREILEHLDNDLELLLNEKEVLFNKTQPTAIKYDKESIMGGKRENRYENYLISVEEKAFDSKIDDIYTRKRLYEKWVTRELKILETYGDLEQSIRYYKEDDVRKCPYTKRTIHNTWEEIGKKVHYTPSYCRRIYKDYKKKREIE